MYHNPPLCSFLISSLKRPMKLWRCLDSIIRASKPGNHYEIICRLNYHDPESFAVVLPFYDRCVMSTITTWPLDGYISLAVFYDQLTRLARGRWVWVLGDDMELQGGQGWEDWLEKVPTTGVIVQPEMHQLNTSGYHHDTNGPCPCIPNQCWKPFGPMIGHPWDRCIYGLLLDQCGWQTDFIPGMTLWHDNGATQANIDAREREAVSDRLLKYVHP